MLAEQLVKGWHGQRGGVYKFARALDPGVVTRKDGNRLCYYFTDKSAVAVSGRGRNHKFAIITKD